MGDHIFFDGGSRSSNVKDNFAVSLDVESLVTASIYDVVA